MFKNIESEGKTKDTFNSNSKAEIITNESDTDGVFKSIYNTAISKTKKIFWKWFRLDYWFNGSSYIKSLKKLDHPRKRLINIQNTDDNDCFKWCLIRYLNPADCNLARIKKSDKDVAKNFDFEDLKFPVRARDIYKIEIKIPSTSVCLLWKIRKNILSMSQKYAVAKILLIY